MRRLILEEWLSLDGFAVDKDGKLDFFPASETDQFSGRDQLAFLDSIDTILLGRKTYELFVAFWPTATTDKEIIAERLNTLPKLVFSNTTTRSGGDPEACAHGGADVSAEHPFGGRSRTSRVTGRRRCCLHRAGCRSRSSGSRASRCAECRWRRRTRPGRWSRWSPSR